MTVCYESIQMISYCCILIKYVSNISQYKQNTIATQPRPPTSIRIDAIMLRHFLQRLSMCDST